MEFFTPSPHPGCATGRSLSHGHVLEAFIRGKTTFGVGELLHAFDCAAWEFRPTPEKESPLWTLSPSYQSLKSGYSALTSYTAQKVKDCLEEEQC